MTTSDARVRQVLAAAERLAPELDALSRRIHAHPEVGFAEVQAAAWLADYLGAHGHAVEREAGGVATAFRAILDVGDAVGGRGPTVALLAEYDALPGIGHGCGHNLIAAAAAGAGALLHAVDDGRLAGRVQVIGTPAEEGGGGKVALLDAGVFRGVDAALMVHPLSRTRIHESLLGRSKLTVEFFGKPAHAAAYPDEGVNALDAMVLHLSGISAMRQQLRPQARVHGIVTHGGDAPNIIPEHTAAVFYVRALDRDYLRELVRRFETCAQGAAQATGTRAAVTAEPFLYEPMRASRTLSGRFRAHLAAAGVEEDPPPPRPPLASSDVGNVSQALPTIHPWIGILPPGEPDVPIHTREFRDAAATDHAHRRMRAAACALALTALDVLGDPACLAAAREEFERGD
ncbi:MAG: M20 family metallopeptidase [Candidatus Rokubacteria bacterium]|nr:M20 family metallopeptidase [Candidatus Rokubacteria bacterium]